MSGQLHALTTLPQGKNPWYPLDRRLSGPQSRSGRGGEEKNSLSPLPGLEPLIIQPVAQRYTTDLSGLFIEISGNAKQYFSPDWVISLSS
jgi:hypothetical protein